MTPLQYEIRTVADFAKVPARRRARCLSEFATWLKMHDDVIALLDPARVGVVRVYVDR